ncbi:GNAT family N-acetyltransferase [Fulvivirgaceae bacterium BMA10]|uniref:GNAT family N-acetyltransferase n=1 Tax=Splendidivirga corallicola TaxID=3051826 RepID=A0ABT8KPC3_9BACT|nr:GNAT family N-acetyltransferase [Fulvivirgaceae bacterium BMA10]
MSAYIISTDRLGLRNWKESDIDPFIDMNKDEAVMEFFPRILTDEESKSLVSIFLNHFEDHGFTYYAVEKLNDQEFIGFIGLKYQTFESDFTPCVDIGWRIKRAAWNFGYATEGAKACLEYGFKALDLKEILAFTPCSNEKSQNVMKKIGMSKVATFEHSRMLAYDHLKDCVVYKKMLTNESNYLDR